MGLVGTGGGGRSVKRKKVVNLKVETKINLWAAEIKFPKLGQSLVLIVGLFHLGLFFSLVSSRDDDEFTPLAGLGNDFVETFLSFDARPGVVPAANALPFSLCPLATAPVVARLLGSARAEDMQVPQRLALGN